MMSNTCLNCSKELTDQFCAGCGQKADTHRITFKNFIFHDLLHGTFHIEKGMLFTARQALFRPGKAALDYISGKRKPYYNVFLLALITIGLIIFLRHFYNEILVSYDGQVADEPEKLNEASRAMNKMAAEGSKLIIFLFVPFAAINSFILFRKKRLNLSEHFIISGMILLGMLLISALGNLLFYFNFIIPFNSWIAGLISYATVGLILFHIGYGYYNAFADVYSRAGIFLRIFSFCMFLALEIVILFMLVFGFITDWKFGYIHFSPFG